jgi:hypothetical protein
MNTSNFNSNFYASNRTYTRQDAEERLIEKGIKEFAFTGQSYSNGASFYFEMNNGVKVRVSDHPLTGNRAFEYVQIPIREIKKIGVNKQL